jgi:hypothetical protein
MHFCVWLAVSGDGHIFQVENESLYFPACMRYLSECERTCSWMDWASLNVVGAPEIDRAIRQQINQKKHGHDDVGGK